MKADIKNPISYIGKSIRTLFSRIKFIRRRKVRNGLDQSFYLFIIGILILIFVGIAGWIFSYIYNMQQMYGISQNEIIYQSE